MKNVFNAEIKSISKLPDPPKAEKHSCAILGRTSASRTSTINKIFGTQEKTDFIRCTEGVKMVVNEPKIQVWDVFGDNDEKT